ncbi:putative 3-hydroxy-3-methylglutaryl-coenzyme a reductase protein [Lasiodiplodia theobromae]|nr:putative 3-hydroxy-3-methylglutaryl-coenzyme a reductase protein [Lasiodiplodia theobromae]
MATTEGALIASTSRGAKALNANGGVSTELLDDAMTRAPILSFGTLKSAAAAKRFIESEEGQRILREGFDSTTRFGHLVGATPRLVGSQIFLRFRARTGDAMGMNMIGKGAANALHQLRAAHRQCSALEEMQIISLSGNLCSDKKAAAINWIEGRGKSICAEAIVPASTVRDILKCSVSALEELNTRKNLVGSAAAGSNVGGFNAQAANIVAAMFVATGQDIAQVVASSNCLTLFEE